jgi:Zn-dependent protease with chaperone function
LLAAYAGQAILHALVAAVVVETLLRLWRLTAPDERLALRLLVLACPLILTPAFAVIAPLRQGDAFRSGWALLAGDHWNQLRIAGHGCWDVTVAILAGAGLVLCLRDVVGFLVDRLRSESHPALPHADDEHVRLTALVRQVADAAGLPAPAVSLLRTATPVLLCAGVLRPQLILSTGTLRRLDADELRASLTHEMAHIAHRDTLLGWTLMGLRVAQLFNPVSQVVGRQAVQEVERRADAWAAATEQREALARALLKLSAKADGPSAPGAPEGLNLPRRVAARAAQAELADRCDRLYELPTESPPGHAPARVAMVAVGLTALLFFVV